MKKCITLLLALLALAALPLALAEESAPVLAGAESGEISALILDEMEDALEIEWSAAGTSEYILRLTDSQPENAEAEGRLLLFGVCREGKLSLPRESLEAGKYLLFAVRDLSNGSDWVWRAWKISQRLNFRGSVEEALAIVDLSRQAVDVQAGRIRRVAQNRSDPWFTREFWENKKYNFVYGGDQLSNSMCTRANYSMAMSYLGLSITPVEMSSIAGSKQVDHNPAAPYDDFTRYLAEENGVSLTRVTGSLDELFENYASDESYSPVYVRLRRKNGNPHVFLVVGRDDDYYYVVDSGEINGSCVHAIRVDEDGKKILKDSGANCWTKYYNAKITYCHQWKIDAAEE